MSADKTKSILYYEVEKNRGRDFPEGTTTPFLPKKKQPRSENTPK